MKVQSKSCVLVAMLMSGFCVPLTYAEPIVESVSYDSESDSVTIIGQGFGEGPNVVLFDDFESKNFAHGDKVPLNSPSVGAWSSANEYYPPLLDNRSHSGKFGFLSYDQEKKVMRQLRANFDGGAQNVFISQWVNVPDGTYFPGSNTTEYRQFPFDSSWKFSWLIDQDTGTESSNICAPTHVGSGIFYIAGNDMNIMKINGNNWWSWNGWNRLTTSLIANSQDPTETGFAEFGALSKEYGLYTQTANVPVFDSDGNAVKKYEMVNFPGWIRPSGENRVETLYDDIYVAIGDNAVKRIELTNNRDYGEIDMASIQIWEKWTDTEIVFTPRKGGLDDISVSNIHLINEKAEAVFLKAFPAPIKSTAKPPVFSF